MVSTIRIIYHHCQLLYHVLFNYAIFFNGNCVGVLWGVSPFRGLSVLLSYEVEDGSESVFVGVFGEDAFSGACGNLDAFIWVFSVVSELFEAIFW